MVINHNEFRKEYDMFEYVARLEEEENMLLTHDKIEAYKTKATLYNKLFLSTNSDDDRRESYRRKQLGAEKGLKDMFGITFKL